jgi:hypothetical protein
MSHLEFRQKAQGPFFWFFLLKKLPLAFFAGVKLLHIDDHGSATSLKFKWINQNPFRSVYFAAMQMAAELATGLLLFQYQSSSTPFSMLLVRVEANYHKKAVGKITFSCKEGDTVKTYITKLFSDNEGHMILIPVVAQNESGDTIADFIFSWSCKNSSSAN